MKNKKSIFLVVLLLVVGFAAVSTTLYINGSTNINPNQDDFNVYYSDAYVNGVQDKSVITDDTHISFTTELSTLGEKYVLDYEVANGSKNYDAELSMSCTSSNDYLKITNDFDDETILEARNTRNGTLTLELKKSNAGEDLNVSIDCTISANAVERTELNDSDVLSGTSFIIEGVYSDENGNILNGANLVIFSDTPHYVTTDQNGYLFYNGLEKGEHEIYHVEDTLENIKSMTKEGIINNAKTSATFKIGDRNSIVFENSYKISNLVIKSNNGYCPTIVGTTWEFDFTNSEQIYSTRCEGVYMLETWGAEGGTANSTYAAGGYGAYSIGKIELLENNILYINVGGRGSYNENSPSILPKGGYNGGGDGGTSNHAGNATGAGNLYVSSGGGATHISLDTGLLSKLNKDKLFIVAAGGGGAVFHDNFSTGSYGHGGHGGGYLGNNGKTNAKTTQYIYPYGTGGQQDKPGSYLPSNLTINYYAAAFGQGASGYYTTSTTSCGGGGGLYGGGPASYAGCGGGSSYIGNPNLTEKAMYCYECATSEDIDTKTISVKTVSDSATANTPKKGNGYAKITYLGTN
mgnify:CR=1 FL=1